jgi:hypothetical protein
MSITNINTGNIANDGSGDPLRVAFQKINQNFQAIDAALSSANSIGSGPAGAVQFNKPTVTATAHAVMRTDVPTSIGTIVVDIAGSGYSMINPPTVTITRTPPDTTGIGATAVIQSISAGGIATIAVTNAGSYYTRTPTVTIGAPLKSSEVAGNANLVYNHITNELSIGANIIPQGNVTIDIGSPTKQIANLWLGPNALHIGNSTVSYANNTLTFRDTVSPSLLTNLVAGNISANTISANTFSIGNLVSEHANIVNTTGNVANTVIAKFKHCDFKTGTIDIHSVEANTSNMQTVQIRASLTDNASNVRFTAHNTLFNGNILINNYEMIVVPTGANISNVITTCEEVHLMITPTANIPLEHTIKYEVIK